MSWDNIQKMLTFRNMELKIFPSMLDPQIFELYEPDYDYTPTDNPELWGKTWRDQLIVPGQVATLAQLCLYVFIDNFGFMYKQVVDIPVMSWELFIQMLPVTIDLGYASEVINDDAYWRKCAERRWPGYHFVNSSGVDSWKQYFLQKYFAEYLENAESDTIDYREAKRFADSFSPYIEKLEITQLNVPDWPTRIETTDSSDSTRSSDSESTRLTGKTLHTYMNRHVHYASHPVTTDRIYLGSIFKLLTRLKELKLSFGYKNYLRHKVMSFASINSLDCLRLGAAIESCPRLEKLTLTSTRVLEEVMEVIQMSIETLSNLVCLELSRLQIGDDFMKNIIRILVSLPNLRSLCLKSNNFSAVGVTQLCQTILHKRCKLQSLDLSQNNIEDLAGLIFASLILQTHCCLRELYLSATGLKSEAGTALGNAIKYNKILRVLDISGNDFNLETAWALFRGLLENKTITSLDVRCSGLPEETVGDMAQICLMHCEELRKKRPIWPKLTNDRIGPLFICDSPESEEDENKKLIEEERERIKQEAIEKKKKELQSFLKKRIHKISVAGIKKKKGPGARVIYPGIFSSGFGHAIDSYVADQERRQVYEARKEVFALEEMSEPEPKEKPKENKQDVKKKKRDLLRFQANVVFLTMGLEQRTRLFGDLDDDTVKDVLYKIIKLDGICPLSKIPPGELHFPENDYVYIPSDDQISEIGAQPKRKKVQIAEPKGDDASSEASAKKVSIKSVHSGNKGKDTGDTKGPEKKKKRRRRRKRKREYFDWSEEKIGELKVDDLLADNKELYEEWEEEEREEKESMCTEKSKIDDGCEEINKYTEIETHWKDKFLYDEEESAQIQAESPAEYYDSVRKKGTKFMKRTGLIPKISRRSDESSRSSENPNSTHSEFEVSEVSAFYEADTEGKLLDGQLQLENDDDWMIYTIWRGKLTILKGAKNRNIWLKRKWLQFLRNAEEYSMEEDEDDGRTKAKREPKESDDEYRVYGTDSLTVTSDGELTSIGEFPEWEENVQPLF